MHLEVFLLSSLFGFAPCLYGHRLKIGVSNKLVQSSFQYPDPFAAAQKIASDQTHAEVLESWRQRLTQGRKQLGASILNGATPSAAQKTYSDAVKLVMIDMLRLASDIAGVNSCPEAESPNSETQCMAPKPRGLEFSMALAGSGGREEMCPFSDVDFFFVPKTEGKVVNMSSPMSMNLSPEGHYLFALARIMRSFADLIELQFCILVAPDDFKGDLIHTPSKLAGLIVNIASGMPVISPIMPNDHIIDSVREASHVSGDLSVTTSLQAAVSKHLDRGFYKARRDAIAFENLLDASKDLPHSFSQVKDRYDIKKDFYRPMQKIVSSLAIYYKIDDKLNSVDRIMSLHASKMINDAHAQQFQSILEAAAGVRILAHTVSGKEQDYIFLGSRSDYQATNAQYPSFFVDQNNLKLKTMHRTLCEALIFLGKLKPQIQNFVKARNQTLSRYGRTDPFESF